MDSCQTGIPTLQRRLRHLHSVAARNVQLPWKRSDTDVSSLELYFTLHKDLHSLAFYTSEKIKGSLNPTWKSLSMSHIVDSQEDINTTSQSVTIRVWYCHGSDSRLCIFWDVHLSGLIYLAGKSLSECIHESPNTLIFGIHNGFYGAPPDASSSFQTMTPESAIPATLTEGTEQTVVRMSYSLRTLQRIQTVLCAIKQTRGTVQRVRHDISHCLHDRLRLDRKRAQCEQSVLKVNMIRADLQWRLVQLRLQKDALETTQISNLQKEVSLRKKWENLGAENDKLRESKKQYFDIRDELIKTGAQLVLRRKQLLAELMLIYPVVQVCSGDMTFHTVCGVRLPHAEDFGGYDETALAIGLGFTCHLVAMISNYLDIPLRYPMLHRGSRSLIYDHIMDKLSDSEREFPLYGKGKEKYQFHYGVYLLNKNIAQLRHYCGISTVDLRYTLENVCTLLCDKLGISLSNDAFTNQYSLIPPSFGGPQIQVGSPRSPGVTASESVTTASQDSESTTQTVISSELIVETGHDVVKDLFPDGMNYQQPDELMSAAERSSISAAGAGFDAALRRASAAEAEEMCNKQHCVDMKYIDAPVDVENSESLQNGHTACSTAWHLMNPGLSKAASDSSIASSVGSILEGSNLDISELVYRTAAVAGHSSFKTHALTERSSGINDAVCSVDESNVSYSLTDKTDRLADDDTAAAQQHISSQHDVSECCVVGHNDNAVHEHCVN